MRKVEDGAVFRRGGMKEEGGGRQPLLWQEILGPPRQQWCGWGYVYLPEGTCVLGLGAGRHRETAALDPRAGPECVYVVSLQRAGARLRMGCVRAQQAGRLQETSALDPRACQHLK